MILRLYLPGNPRPAPRARVVARGQNRAHGYRPKWYVQQSAEWGYQAQGQAFWQKWEVAHGRCAVKVTFRRATFHTADIDNLFKAFADALKGIIWGDDAQVDSAVIYVERGVGQERAGVLAEIWELGSTVDTSPVSYSKKARFFELGVGL